ncbi:MAG: STAS domain-containing protein [Candidatus Acidiferrales bacterium]
MAVQISVREAQGVAVLDLKGGVVLAPDGKALHERVKQLVAQNKTKILLNVSEVTHIDSTGLGELVSGFSLVKKSGGQLKLANATDKLQRIIRLTNLQAILENYPSESEALASFK